MNISEMCVNCKQNNSCTMCWRTSNKKCPHFIQKTNADRIRAMSDEDMAVWIASMASVCECCAELNECEAPKCFNRCSRGVEEWLKHPAE